LEVVPNIGHGGANKQQHYPGQEQWRLDMVVLSHNDEGSCMEAIDAEGSIHDALKNGHSCGSLGSCGSIKHQQQQRQQ